MLEPLTERQAAILRFVTEEISVRRRSPSLQEVMTRFRFSSSNAVRDHLAALERKGYLTRGAGKRRCIALTPEYEETLGLPVVGQVAAGTPILAEENITDHLPAGGLFPRDGRHFCLEVRGNSMIGEGIKDGDYVVVRQKPVFENGEVGVAVIDGECTVKKLRREGEKVRLIPANEEFEETVVDLAESQFDYVGEVVGVIRLRGGARRNA